MVDFLDEVQDDLRRERNEKLWDKYSPYLFGLACVVVFAVGGYKYYQTQQIKNTQDVAAKYEKALDLAQAGKNDEAVVLLTSLSTQAGAYKDLARFVLAGEIAKRNPSEGVKAFDELVTDTSLDKTMRDDAAIRAGYLLVDTASYEEIKTRLMPLTQEKSTFRLAAKEIIGLSAFKANDIKGASEIFTALKTDIEATNTLKLRSDVMLSVIAGQK